MRAGALSVPRFCGTGTSHPATAANAPQARDTWVSQDTTRDTGSVFQVSANC